MPSRAEELEVARALKARTRFGVFRWQAANMYQPTSALKIYTSKALAEKYAAKLNETCSGIGEDGFVVRSYTVPNASN